MAAGGASGQFKRHFKMAKSWMPRRCFICEEKGGWGKKNVDAIWVHGFHIGYFWAHFHPHCLKDAICCPGNYENKVVEKAVNIYTKWEQLLLDERLDKKDKENKLKNAQDKICEGVYK